MPERLLLGSVMCLFLACGANDPPTNTGSQAATTAPAGGGACRHQGGGGAHAESSAPIPRDLGNGAQAFGGEMSTDRAVTPLAQIVASPDRFAGQTVKTEGTIATVCQHMGCWVELRVDGSDQVVRVPMAGHSFFLPRDVAGKHATVEGTVVVEQLSEEMRVHLAAEGSHTAGQPLQIEATAVVIN